MKKTLLKTDQNNPQIKAYKDAVKRGMESQHVIYRGDEWVVKKAGAQGVGQAFQTKDEAARYAREAAKSQGTSLFIHNTNGTISEAAYFGGE